MLLYLQFKLEKVTESRTTNITKELNLGDKFIADM